MIQASVMPAPPVASSASAQSEGRTWSRVARASARSARLALQRLQVPGERQEVAPVALVLEKLQPPRPRRAAAGRSSRAASQACAAAVGVSVMSTPLCRWSVCLVVPAAPSRRNPLRYAGSGVSCITIATQWGFQPRYTGTAGKDAAGEEDTVLDYGLRFSDPAKYSRALRRAHELVISGVPRPEIPNRLADSWRRSMALGISPDQHSPRHLHDAVRRPGAAAGAPAAAGHAGAARPAGRRFQFRPAPAGAHRRPRRDPVAGGQPGRAAAGGPAGVLRRGRLVRGRDRHQRHQRGAGHRPAGAAVLRRAPGPHPPRVGLHGGAHHGPCDGSAAGRAGRLRDRWTPSARTRCGWCGARSGWRSRCWERPTAAPPWVPRLPFARPGRLSRRPVCGVESLELLGRQACRGVC